MASYEWLKATLFQTKEKKDRTDEEKEFINKYLTKDKYKNRTPQQAAIDFIDSCQWSWNTEDCLKLMKKGLVPYYIVYLIIQETWGITNKIFSIFNSKASLQSLIGSKRIAILNYRDYLIALDPSDTQEENDTKIEQFFEKIKGDDGFKKDIKIFMHGTGGYAEGFLELAGGVVFYPSNIPNWGPVATINGSKKRINEHKVNINKIITEHLKKFNQETSNKKEILIKSTSYGNAMGVECSRILADDLNKKHILNIRKVARDFFIFQSAEDLFNSIDKIQNKKNIDTIKLFSEHDFVLHPVSKTTWLKDRLLKETENNEKYKGINIEYERGEDIAAKFAAEEEKREREKEIQEQIARDEERKKKQHKKKKIDKKENVEEEKQKLNNDANNLINTSMINKLPVNKIDKKEYVEDRDNKIDKKDNERKEINNDILTINKQKENEKNENNLNKI